MDRIRTKSFMLATAALAGLTVLSVSGGAAAQGSNKRCTPAGQNVEAERINNLQGIIDDSGSMKDSDPNRLRLSGVELFLSDPDNRDKTLGVVEFGDTADTVFLPARIGRSRGAMLSALRSRMNADEGDTSYDAAFNKATADNPSAEARIFVTDGQDNKGFTNTHRGGPRTFVVGLGIGTPSPSNPAANRLQQIADETGGVYFPRVEDATLQPTFKTISAAINCRPRPRRFRSGWFWKKGLKSTRTVTLGEDTTGLELAINWANPRNKFGFSRIELLSRRNRVLANLDGKGSPRKIRKTRVAARTFRSVGFRKTRGATKLRFTVVARRVDRRGGERTITVLSERE